LLPKNFQSGLKALKLIKQYTSTLSIFSLLFALQLGQNIRIYSNEIRSEYGGFSFGYGKAIWNNNQPDTAVLHDA